MSSLFLSTYIDETKGMEHMLMIGFTLLFILFLLTSYLIWIHTMPITSKKADALIILGYKTDREVMSPLLEERLRTAIKLLRVSKFKRIIVTGGIVGNSSVPEAHIMKDFLSKHGVDTEMILLEPKAKDTIENLIYSKKVMDMEGLDSCVIISNAFHMRRIKIIASSLQLHAHFYTNKSWKAFFNQIDLSLKEIRALYITVKLLNQMKRERC